MEETYVTWYESDKGILIEDILEAKGIDYEIVATPFYLREQDVMICKDCILIPKGGAVLKKVKSLFPPQTAVYRCEGALVWQ